jgi:hypothetical protein
MAHAPGVQGADVLPAPEQLHQLQTELATSRKAADWDALLQAAHRHQAFLNGSPLSSLELARAELLAGHRPAALVQLRHFVAMGQTHELLSTPLFQPLRTALEPLLAANRVAVSRSQVALRLLDPDLLPEDVDYDFVSKRFLLTSVRKHLLVTADASGRQQVFAQSPDGWPMAAVKVDPGRRLAWVTEVAFAGFTSVPEADWGRSALLEYDLDSGLLLSRHEGPPHSSLADLTLAWNGDPIASDGEGGGIYRLHDNQFQRIDHGEFVSPQTIALCPDGKHAFVPDYVRGIAAFDLATGAVQWLPSKERFALDGIDGLYCQQGRLTAVQNGTLPMRVIVFTLDRSYFQIVGEQLLERSSSTLGVPTHGVFIGTTFYYIANSGWDRLDDHGSPTVGTSALPALIMRVAALQRR